ncbi:MAG: hypothetical protein AAF219_07265 [Myxococcota bacterium]
MACSLHHKAVMTDNNPCHRRAGKPSPSHLRLVDGRDTRSPSRVRREHDPGTFYNDFDKEPDDEAVQAGSSHRAALKLLQLLVWLAIALYVGSIFTAD